jgi:proteasome lid subunit RPN8/RPN11
MMALLLIALDAMQGSVVLTTSAYEEMRAHAAAASPNEAVGLILGYVDSTTNTAVISKSFPCENIALEPSVEAAIPSECMLMASLMYPTLEVAGSYHSHSITMEQSIEFRAIPRAEPSELDRAYMLRSALSGFPVHVILAVQPNMEVWTSLWGVGGNLMIFPIPFLIEEAPE